MVGRTLEERRDWRGKEGDGEARKTRILEHGYAYRYVSQPENPSFPSLTIQCYPPMHF